jgi:hypothetical protein
MLCSKAIYLARWMDVIASLTNRTRRKSDSSTCVYLRHATLPRPRRTQNAYEEGLTADCHAIGLRRGLQTAILQLQESETAAPPAALRPQIDLGGTASSTPASSSASTRRSDDGTAAGGDNSMALCGTGAQLLVAGTSSTSDHQLLSIAARAVPELPLVQQLTPKRAEVSG